MSRISPLEPPYAPELQQVFDRVMPPGIPPLVLFRTLATSPRVFERFRGGSLLDRGALALRHRELVIARTCALAGCEYEWGVHVTFFAEKVGFGPEELSATVHEGPEAACWSPAERALLRACDALHATARLSDATWAEVRAHFDEAQVLELLALAGYYRMVAYQANALALPPEPFAARFPPRA